jgi:hypothetical protein
MKRFGLAAAILLSAFATSSAAQAAPATRYQFRGLSGTASGDSYDECGSASVVAGANKETVHDGPGGPVTNAYGFVYWYRYDWCNGVFSGGYAQGVLKVSGGQTTITASGPLGGYDFGTGNAVTIDANFTIDSTGNYVSRGESMWHNATPYGSIMQRAVGTYSEATLSGSVKLGDTELLAGMTQSYGTLMWANSGTIQLTHY